MIHHLLPPMAKPISRRRYAGHRGWGWDYPQIVDSRGVARSKRGGGIRESHSAFSQGFLGLAPKVRGSCWAKPLRLETIQRLEQAVRVASPANSASCW